MRPAPSNVIGDNLSMAGFIIVYTINNLLIILFIVIAMYMNHISQICIPFTRCKSSYS